jgi:hypothetical protein
VVDKVILLLFLVVANVKDAGICESNPCRDRADSKERYEGVYNAFAITSRSRNLSGRI